MNPYRKMNASLYINLRMMVYVFILSFPQRRQQTNYTLSSRILGYIRLRL